MAPPVADVAVPAERRRLLDRDPGRHLRWEHLVAVLLGLAVEQLPARHAHDAGADALGGRVRRGRRARAPPPSRWRAGSRPGLPDGRLGQHVGALAATPDAAPSLDRSKVGRACRDRTSAAGSRRSAATTRQVSTTSFASAGRNTSSPGIARSDASCSTGWWVGSVLADPDRVVGEDVQDRDLHQRRQPDRAACVVGEDQEPGPVRPELGERHAVGDRGRRVLPHAEVEVASRVVARAGSRWRRRRSRRVFVDGVRSAEPPSSQGTAWARAFSTRPEESRVAMPFGSGGNVGRAASQPSGSSRRWMRSSSSARAADTRPGMP